MGNSSANSPPLLTAAEQQAVRTSVSQVQRAAEGQLAAHPHGEFPLLFIAKLHEGLSLVMQRALDGGSAIACRAGCSHCCGPERS